MVGVEDGGVERRLCERGGSPGRWSHSTARAADRSQASSRQQLPVACAACWHMSQPPQRLAWRGLERRGLGFCWRYATAPRTSSRGANGEADGQVAYKDVGWVMDVSRKSGLSWRAGWWVVYQ